VSGDDALRRSYDAVTDEYVRRIYDELAGKPFDREFLDRFAAPLRGAGTVAELGCGPGHVARYLHERGVDVIGLDLSPAMVEAARRLNPGIEFRAADFTALDVPDAAWAGAVAFYAIVHLDDAGLLRAFREWRRVLRPRAPLALAFHVGDETVHRDEWWGHAVDLTFRLLPTQAVTGALVASGFVVDEVLERDPYPDVEYPSRRAYLVARAL